MVKCMENPDNKKTDCTNAGNYAHELKAPTLIIQSLYDHYSLRAFYFSPCLTNDKYPYSLENCDNKTRQFIEDFKEATW